MKLNNIKPKFKKHSNPRIGLIALATDFNIEKDFNSVFSKQAVDLFVNRLPSYNPLTNENFIKMTKKLTEITANILPQQTLDCVAFGCTSGTIAAGVNSITNKIQDAKPGVKVTTPITSAIKALRKFKINNISVFTPYTKKINQTVLDYFKSESFNVKSFSAFNIDSDLDIAKIDVNFLFDTLSNLNLKGSDALFVSCTALPVLEILDKLEKKIGKIVMSSNQTLIWEAHKLVGNTQSVKGYGKLLREPK